MGHGAGYAVIVRRGRQDVFESLRAHSDELGVAQVMWDRRVRDRRVIIRDVAKDRRRTERRGPSGPMWDGLGFMVVQQAARDEHIPDYATIERPAAQRS
jgi:hypothetical protein